MEAIVTLTGYETKSGTGQRGPWTVHIFSDGSSKYSTFDAGLGRTALGLLNAPARIVYEAQERGNKLVSIEAAPAGASAPQGTTPTQSSGGARQGDWSPEKELRVTRAGIAQRLGPAMFNALPADEQTFHNALLIAERLVRYAYEGYSEGENVVSAPDEFPAF